MTNPVCEMTNVCNMTIQQSSIPALSIPRNKVVAVEEIQLQILTLLHKYSTRKWKLDYSFAIKNTKLTFDVDILPGEENHYTVAGGRGARRRRRTRRKDSEHVDQKDKPKQTAPPAMKQTVSLTRHEEPKKRRLKRARDLKASKKPTLQEKPVLPPRSEKPPRLPPRSEKPALQVQTRDLKRSEALTATPKEPLKRVEELLDKQNKKIDLNDQPWFFGSISRQEVSDLMTDKGEIGDYVVRESSKYGHLVLTWKDVEDIKHMKITIVNGLYLMGKEERDWKRFDSLEALVQSNVDSGLIIKPLSNKQAHKKDAEKRYKRSLARRIFCFYCKQFHEPVHFCHRTQKFRHVDTFHMMELTGNTRNSVERPPGYDVDDCQFRFHQSKYIMLCDQFQRATAENSKELLFPVSGPMIYE